MKKYMKILVYISIVVLFLSFNLTFAKASPNISNEKNLQKEIVQIYTIGLNNFKNKNYSNCIDSLSKIEKFMSNNINFQIMLGESYRQQNNLSRAISHFKQALSLGSKDRITLSGLSKSLIDSGQFKEGLLVLDELLRNYPTDRDYFLKGLVCKELNNNVCLLDSMENVIKINKTFGSDPYIYTGNIYSSQNNLDKSLNVYLLGLNYFPNDLALNYYTGDLFLYFDKINDAIFYLNKSIKIDPKFIDGNYLLGMAFLKQDNLDLAYQQCLVVKKLDNNKSDLSKNLCSQVEQKIQLKQMQMMQQQQQIQDQINQEQIDNTNNINNNF